MKTSKIRYFVVALIAAILVSFSALSLTGCGEPEPEHYHSWGEWTVITAATCTTEGVRTRVCRDDASHIDTQPISIDRDAHNWGEWTFTEPTADNYYYGTKTRICAYNNEHKETNYLDGTYGDFSYSYGASSIAITGYTGPGGAVEIPSTIDGKPVTAIGRWAFSDSNSYTGKGLTSVSIPNSLITIEDSAFYGNRLTGVIIPNSVITIGDSAFAYSQLTGVTIPNSVITIGNRAFSDNKLTSVIIPNSVITIGNRAFYYNKLTSVTIPNSVTTIGDEAFQSNQLTSVTIGNSVTTIGDSAFYSNQLTSVTIGNSVTSIGHSAFAYNQLTSVTIGNGITSIGDGTYYGGAFFSNPLVSITIGANLPIDEYSIGDGIGDSYFFKVYHDALRAAGTYTRTDTNTIWTKNP